ncbi:hypothetical protein TIFTF001_053018, partial [Ficus carica]
SIYKRRSTGDTKVALTDTIYEKKVRSSFFPAAIRFRLKALKTEQLSILTSDQPAKGCEVGPGTKNESISVYGSCWPAAAQLFERNTVVVGFDSTRVECLVEGPIHPIEPTLKGGPQAQGSTKQKVSALRNFLLGLYDQRDQSARERGYSSSGEAKSSPLLIEPSVRRSSSTCYEASVFGGSPLLDLERRTSGQGKAQCAWPTEATFLSALFKRLASARGERQGHKVSSVGSLSQEGTNEVTGPFRDRGRGAAFLW